MRSLFFPMNNIAIMVESFINDRILSGEEREEEKRKRKIKEEEIKRIKE